MPTVWELEDEADKLISASESWSDVAAGLGETADSVNAGASSVRAAGWEGETATAFDGHRKSLVGGLDQAESIAGTISSTLAMVAGSVRIAQGRLDQEWAKVAAIPHSGDPSCAVTFQTEDDEQAARVEASIKAAEGIRSELDGTLAEDAAALRKAAGEWKQISAAWEAIAVGGEDPFPLPSEGKDTGVITDGDRTIVNTGAGDDKVRVGVDPFTGDTIVTVNGETYRIPAGQEVVIRGGGGNDTITVNGNADLDLTIAGSDGDDSISGGGGDDTILGLDGDDEVDAGAGDDRVSGGADRDYVDGQDGDDTVAGGTGDDTVYGLDGDDTVSGGEGQDYLEGGKGDDEMLGDEGNDVVSGGRGDDTLRGGGGDDVSYAGHGEDSTYGGSGSDTSYAEGGDHEDGTEQRVTVQIPDTTYFFKIEGSPEFVDRVEADIDMLRNSPRGQEMLANLQNGQEDSGTIFGINKDTLTIREYNDPSDPNNSTASNDGHGNYEINYNTRIDHLGTPGGTVEGPPNVVLYHELAHVYDYLNGTSFPGDYQGDDELNHGTENDERQAAGLPIDHDGDPDTPERIDPDHPYGYTENGLRDEMGMPHRDHY